MAWEICPYVDCNYAGDSATVDDHITYMVGVVQDHGHSADKRRGKI